MRGPASLVRILISGDEKISKPEKSKQPGHIISGHDS